jgi:hypothetical protein
MPEPLIKLLVMPIIDGYTGQSSAEVHFNRCMTSELI